MRTRELLGCGCVKDYFHVETKAACQAQGLGRARLVAPPSPMLVGPLFVTQRSNGRSRLESLIVC